MSDRLCPDWRSLLEDRDRSADGEARWRLGLEHAAGCAACHGELAEADPVAVFALSAVSRNAVPADEDPEVAAMLQAVTAVRRHREAPRSVRTLWLSRAAVAVLALSFGLLSSPRASVNLDTAGEPIEAGAAEAPEPAGSEPATLGPVTVGAALAELEADGSIDPAVGPLDRLPRVYRWHDRELSVVMIVDETLDV